MQAQHTSEHEVDLEAGIPVNVLVPDFDSSHHTTDAVDLQDAGGPASTKDRLSRKERQNLALCLLAWACTVSNITLTVGTSAVIAVDVGAKRKFASVPLGLYFLGCSLVSVLVTPWAFKWGRKFGLMLGIGFGEVGAILGALSVQYHLPWINFMGAFFAGMSTGLGFYLRYAVAEVVPSWFLSRAMTLVLSGGMLASFAGPEAAAASASMFPEKQFMGLYISMAAFNVLNAVFTMLSTFKPVVPKITEAKRLDENPEIITGNKSSAVFHEVVFSATFLVPMLISTLSWAIMNVPFGLIGLVLEANNFSTRQIRLAVEMHFLFMYLPGLVSGGWIAKYGPYKVCWIAVLVYTSALLGVGLANNLVALSVGFLLLAAAWNLSYNSATVWLTTGATASRAISQSAHDFCMFFFSGVWITWGSYIYQMPSGWRTLILVVSGLVFCLALILCIYRCSLSDKNDKRSMTMMFEKNLDKSEQKQLVIPYRRRSSALLSRVPGVFVHWLRGLQRSLQCVPYIFAM